MTAAFVLDPGDVLRGCEAFRSHEKRGAMYKVATFLLKYYWGRPADMADGLGVLLLTWNQALYRYGGFDFAALENILREKLSQIEEYRGREITSFTASDEPTIAELFTRLLDALKIADGKSKGKKDPVAVAKAMHLLAPRFFPLWDDKIAKAYNCRYLAKLAKAYIALMRITRDIVAPLPAILMNGECSVLKIIDEYNYAKFTKAWI